MNVRDWAQRKTGISSLTKKGILIFKKKCVSTDQGSLLMSNRWNCEFMRTASFGFCHCVNFFRFQESICRIGTGKHCVLSSGWLGWATMLNYSFKPSQQKNVQETQLCMSA